jgi:hypothetical protein
LSGPPVPGSEADRPVRSAAGRVAPDLRSPLRSLRNAHNVRNQRNRTAIRADYLDRQSRWCPQRIERSVLPILRSATESRRRSSKPRPSLRLAAPTPIRVGADLQSR